MRRILSLTVSFLLVFSMMMPGTSKAGVFVSVAIAPPALPVYVPPEPPGPDYIWAPGYWAYDSFFEDYYWVPGTWVLAPTPGFLWTPGYWYWRNGMYIYSAGYWGPHVGFYGGIDYGYGYGGHGYYGGYWDHDRHWHHDEHWGPGEHTGFNGGPDGIKARPTPEEQTAMKEHHIPATTLQRRHIQAARKTPALRASVNHGRPAIAATSRPGVFKGKGVVAARKEGAYYKNNRIRRKPAVKKHAVKKPAPKPDDNKGNQ